MAYNYLSLCQALVDELGIAGSTGPSSTLNNTDPDMINVVNWIAQANDYINDLHMDWDWLWNRFTGVLTVGAGGDIAPTPTGAALPIRKIDQMSMWLNYGTPSPQRLRFVNYQYARTRWSVQKISQRPTYMTIRPNRVLELNYIPTLADTIQYDYWGVPPVLNNGVPAQDTNVPLLPVDFQRIILVRAMMMYAQHEDAPEIMSGAAAEYSDLLPKLESAYWPGNESATMAHSNDPDLQFSTSDDGYDGQFNGPRFA